MLNFTRKKYLEVWHVAADGTGTYVSQHVSLVEAAESAYGDAENGDLTDVQNYEIRIGSEVWYTMTLQARSITAFPNANGDVDTVVPVPDAGQDVVWATVGPFENQVQSVAFSEDMRLLLSGTGAATAVISIDPVGGISGDSPAVMGLSIVAGDDLETAAATVSAGVIRLKATYLSVDYFSNEIPFSVVAVATPDTVAPTPSLFATWEAIDDTQIDLTIIPGSDIKTPSSEADGMDSIDIYRNEDGGAYSFLVNKPLPGPGISPQLLDNTIGSHGIAPSSIQTGSQWELTAEGGDIDNDQIFLVAGQVAGDFDLTCSIAEFSAPVLSKTQAQLMVRDTVAAGSKLITCGRISNTASSPAPIYSEVRWRPEDGATVQWNNPQNNLNGTYWFWINRTGDVFSCYIFKEGDPRWTLLQQATIVMSQSVLAGIWLGSLLPGTTSTVPFTNVSVQNLAHITHSDTSLTEQIAYGYKLKSIDLSP